MDRAFLIGCSNLTDQNKTDIWKSKLDCPVVYNLSNEGAGNKFIFDQLMYALDTKKRPDYVYLQFSGLYRTDLIVTSDNGLKFYPYIVQRTSDMYWLLSGGKNGAWQDYNVAKKFFLPFYIDDNDSALVFNSLNYVYASVGILEHLKIPYNFTFYYNIFVPKTEYIEVQEGSNQTLNDAYCSNFLNTFPHDYCFDNNALLDDGIHFDDDAYNNWVKSLKLSVDK